MALKDLVVRATRAQACRQRYQMAIRQRLEQQHGLTLFQQAVDDILIEGQRVVGVMTAMGFAFKSPRWY